MGKRSTPKELTVTASFVDAEGNVIYESMEEAFSKLSQPEQNKLLARILSATTGKKYTAL